MTKLEEILLADNVTLSIKENFEQLTTMIPEILYSVNFPHNNPSHHLDVWNHTLLVLSKTPPEFNIRIVALLHDIGKPFSYQDEEIRHFKNHPKVSKMMSEKIFNRLNIKNSGYLLKLIERHDDALNLENANENDFAFYRDMIIIQYCDGMSHHPNKLQKRINYLKTTILNYINLSTKYNKKPNLPENVLSVLKL